MKVNSVLKPYCHFIDTCCEKFAVLRVRSWRRTEELSVENTRLWFPERTYSVVSTDILVPALRPSRSSAGTAIPLPWGCELRMSFFASSSEIISFPSAGKLSILETISHQLVCLLLIASTHSFHIFGKASFPKAVSFARPRSFMIHRTTQMR